MAGKVIIDYNGGEFFIKLLTDRGEPVDFWEVGEESLSVTPAAKEKLLIKK